MMDADGIQLLVGGGAIGALAPLASAWIKARFSKTQIAPQPLEVKGAPQFVTKEEFEKHAAANARDHENLFSRLNRNDRDTSEIKGMLGGIRDDLAAIKGKLFKTGK
ncbi:MAG: hypothetical protein IJL06_11080 [Kiritimatiellae bacterium]|nr:hypothetical protein [Kiritimatiellia bacterium]